MPKDDGACDHLRGATTPFISLPSTAKSSEQIDLSKLPGCTIVFCYPRTGAPNETVPASWDAIPGARGCTPQACSFRDNLPALKAAGVQHLFGLSTQDTAYQTEVRERLHLPYDLLSDDKGKFREALRLPTFDWEGKKVIRRLTLAVEEGKIIECWYPVFPPDANVRQVLEWLQKRSDGKDL